MQITSVLLRGSIVMAIGRRGAEPARLSRLFVVLCTSALLAMVSTSTALAKSTTAMRARFGESAVE